MVPGPLLKAFTVCPCQERKTKQKKKKNCKREEGGGVLPCPPPADLLPAPASVLSLVVIVLLLFAVGQGRAGADLPVAIQPLLHHLGDERMVAAAGAFLKSHQDSAIRHTAVQPLPQELLLLLFITHLKEREKQTQDTYTNESSVEKPFTQVNRFHRKSRKRKTRILQTQRGEVLTSCAERK